MNIQGENICFTTEFFLLIIRTLKLQNLSYIVNIVD